MAHTLGRISATLFEIAKATGLDALQPGSECPEAVYQAFCGEYLKWATDRDAAVTRYLKETPREFRTYIPFTLRTFQIASEVFWYYDEIVTLDPLKAFVRADSSSADLPLRTGLLHNYHLLSKLRDQIETGLILLLSGCPADPNEAIPPEVEEAARTPAIIEALNAEVEFSRETERLSTGITLTRVQARLESACMVSVQFENVPPGESFLPIMKVGAPLPPVSRNELGDTAVAEFIRMLQYSYPHEVMHVVRRLRAADRLGAGVLFDRSSNAKIATTLSNRTSPDPSVSLSMALPYVNGIPRQALADLRERIPEAFLDFRRRIADITRTAATSAITQADIDAAVEREVRPQLRALSAEMEAAARRARIIGYGVPAVIAMGTLGAVLTGGVPPVVLAGTATGILPAISAAADFAHRKSALRANPFYFLWRVKQS